MQTLAHRSQARCPGRNAGRLASRPSTRVHVPRAAAEIAVSVTEVVSVIEAPVQQAVGVLADEQEWTAAIQASAARGDLVVVDYYTQWCGPCKLIAPRVEEIAQEFKDKKVRVYKMDCGATDNNKRMAMTLKIRVLPTFRFYKNGSTEHFTEMTGSKADKLYEVIEAEASEL